MAMSAQNRDASNEGSSSRSAVISSDAGGLSVVPTTSNPLAIKPPSTSTTGTHLYIKKDAMRNGSYLDVFDFHLTPNSAFPTPGTPQTNSFPPSYGTSPLYSSSPRFPLSASPISPRRVESLDRKCSNSPLTVPERGGAEKDIPCCGQIHATYEDLLRHYEQVHAEERTVEGKRPQARPLPIFSPAYQEDDMWDQQQPTGDLHTGVSTTKPMDILGKINSGGGAGGLFPAGTGNVDADLSALLAAQPSEDNAGSQILAKRNLSAAAFSMGSYAAVELKRFREGFRWSGVDFSDILDQPAINDLPSHGADDMLPSMLPAVPQAAEDMQLDNEQQVEQRHSQQQNQNLHPTSTPIIVPATSFTTPSQQVTSALSQQLAPAQHNRTSPTHAPQALHPPGLSHHLNMNMDVSPQLPNTHQQSRNRNPENGNDIVDYLITNLEASTLATPPVRPVHAILPAPLALDSSAIQIPGIPATFSPAPPPSHQQTLLQRSAPPKKPSQTKKEQSDSTPKPFKCPHDGCLKSYKNPNGLKYHLEHGHPEISPPPSDSSNSQKPPVHKPFRCTFCDKRYKNLNGLKYHLVHAHACDEGQAKIVLGRAKSEAAFHVGDDGDVDVNGMLVQLLAVTEEGGGPLG
ncbi:uncharacterized protein SPPG_06369 [Spizellomyces punctatus DAOM BR117]|uniref:C2H2-type domain-containing protein n=1 Tax=Spizellomyces punctatus (strain DAOM BR117) TaxID=645134 RepID=A0A0L0HD95_SPIPD|nr:uncharacterized protein SPPG_06369 [Spizellomyces punctatus DAOM BR117]KNC98688.1 hypothetical protein SPPG_06369 [Spizellomyces punctatus DAOM BR117]|eukprot:XP_016606728.1 hypothetical protein SPPG_06369 [Spizellomyces punctatus DAOM BR117]